MAHRLRLSNVVWASLAVAALGAVALLGAVGQDYFLLPRSARPFHELHRQLGPSGQLGHWLGMVGLGLMALNLLYLVRRRWARVERFGSLKAWLTFHVSAGVSGIALAFGHSAGLFRNPLAMVALAAAGVVLLTGIAGRWLYGKLQGEDGEACEAELVRGLRASLAEVPEALRATAEQAELTLTRMLGPAPRSLWGTVLAASRDPLDFVRLYLARRQLKRALALSLPPDEVRQIVQAATRAAVMRQRARRVAGLKAVVGTWRGLHRIATFLLILAVTAHVLTVVSYSR